jgi:hypothetical protein
MPELLWPLGAVVLTLLLGAWREAVDGNRRDAALLAGFGVSGALTTAAALLV